MVELVELLPETYWFHRSRINSLPTKGDPTSSYGFLGHNQMPKGLRDYLFSIAPEIPGAVLGEAIVNRYDVGDYMPEHVDLAFYDYNMVIALTDAGDGVEVQGEFYKDEPGRALVFSRKSEPHEVPPVKTKRYVLIYLYS